MLRGSEHRRITLTLTLSQTIVFGTRFARFLTSPWELSEWQIDDRNARAKPTRRRSLFRGSG
jgi:hypothetical protein